MFIPAQHRAAYEDHRNPLQKLTRKELEYLARLEKREDIKPNMPADIMRLMFMQVPPAIIPKPLFQGRLGVQGRRRVPCYEDWLKLAFDRRPVNDEVQEVPPVDAIVHLQQSYESEQVKQAVAEEKIDNSVYENMVEWEMHEVRKAAKNKGLKIRRNMGKHDIIKMIRTHDAKNASQ